MQQHRRIRRSIAKSNTQKGVEALKGYYPVIPEHQKSFNQSSW